MNYRMWLIEFLSVQRASGVISRRADACENCILYPIHQSSEYSCYTLIMRYYIKRVQLKKGEKKGSLFDLINFTILLKFLIFPFFFYFLFFFFSYITEEIFKYF